MPDCFCAAMPASSSAANTSLASFSGAAPNSSTRAPQPASSARASTRAAHPAPRRYRWIAPMAFMTFSPAYRRFGWRALLPCPPTRTPRMPVATWPADRAYPPR
ncbi:Uncharacterised protein [Bordetella pertussis]|nr:Uncharacterised protein [Bordetella pertussis]